MAAFMILVFISADFPICNNNIEHYLPTVTYLGNQYCVVWKDLRLRPLHEGKAHFGSRVTKDGAVLDPDGKVISADGAGKMYMAYDGVNFLGVSRNSC